MKVFISHADADAELAKRIAAALKQADFQVWDETQVLPGENWGAQLAEALSESEAMIVLLTREAVNSSNVVLEIGYALGKQDFKGRIIPVIAAPPGQIPQDAIPWILRKFPTIYMPNREQDEEGMRKIAEALKMAA